MIGRSVEKAILHIHLKDITARNSDTCIKKDEANSSDDITSKTMNVLKSKNIGNQSGLDKIFEFIVQYNPASLTLSSGNGNKENVGLENDVPTNSAEMNESNENAKDALNNHPEITDVFSVNSTLSFDLIFDDCNGVRKRMDSIISLLSSSFTQQVIFYWHDMNFKGTVTKVSYTYTMFNSLGIPIRGSMKLNIVQKAKDEDVNDKLYWDNAFYDYFNLLSPRGFSRKNIFDTTEKAVLVIADFSERKEEKNDVAAPKAGKGAIGLRASFEEVIDKIKNYGKDLNSDDNESFAAFKGFKTYRFECQFNPAKLSMSGSGSSNIPTIESKSRSVNTIINLNFTLIFDKTANQDEPNCSVQPEVEALTAIVRDEKKRMATFTWGKKSYQGAINSVNATYKMFNSIGEPLRASVAISMTVYDERVSGALSDIWADEYMKDIYNAK